MEPFVTMGLVLKETRYREADRILTILTPKLGVITAMAANSLRLKSKLFSACGLFCYSEFTLVPGRNMYTVREAEVQNIFHGISSSIEGVSLAMYLTELAAALSPTGEEAARELRLVLNSLYMISEHRTDLRVIKAVFELRTMSECGFLPQLVYCRDCGTYDGPAFYQISFLTPVTCTRHFDHTTPTKTCILEILRAQFPLLHTKNSLQKH